MVGGDQEMRLAMTGNSLLAAAQQALIWMAL